MIRELSGTVIGSETGGAIIDVAGFGIFVHLATADSLTPGEKVSLKTYMAFRQDGVELYERGRPALLRAAPDRFRRGPEDSAFHILARLARVP
jgi:hypothetical protein